MVRDEGPDSVVLTGKDATLSVILVHLAAGKKVILAPQETPGETA